MNKSEQARTLAQTNGKGVTAIQFENGKQVHGASRYVSLLEALIFSHTVNVNTRGARTIYILLDSVYNSLPEDSTEDVIRDNKLEIKQDYRGKLS